MLKKTMTTVDFGGTERTEDYYFNLTRAEIMEMELTTDGGLVQMINRITAAQSQESQAGEKDEDIFLHEEMPV